MSISKVLDNSSAILAQFAINGNSIGTVDVCFLNLTEDVPRCYLYYELDRTFVKSWSTSADTNDIPVEEVAFYYNKIGFAYSEDGNKIDTNVMSWNNVQNIPWFEVIEKLWSMVLDENPP